MKSLPPQGVQCECGCGLSFPARQMVHKKSSNEDLYIPHCIDVYQLFCDPKELREKLIESGINTHFYALPGEGLTQWIELMQGTFQFHQYVKFFDKKYGVYFVWEVSDPSPEVNQFTKLVWDKDRFTDKTGY